MNVICLGGKGSAVTTSALALAGGWPTARPIVLVEADASGGDLAARFDLPSSPNLLTAAASLQQPTFGLLLEHTYALPGGLRVIPAPLRSVEVSGGLNDFMRSVLAPLRGSETVDLVVDAGRGDPRVMSTLIPHADLVVIVIRQDLRSAKATVGRCLHAQQLVEPLAARGVPTVALVVGDAPYRPTDIGQFLGLAEVATLPEDPHGAALLAGAAASTRVARRSSIAKAARTASAALVAQLTPLAQAAPVSVSAP